MSTTSVSERQPFVAEFEAFERAHPLPSERLQQLRKLGLRRFDQLGFPTTRMEEWRFTNVAPIAKTQFKLVEENRSLQKKDLEPFVYPGCDQLVFVNGRYSTELSKVEALPDGVIVCSLAEAMTSHADKVEAHLGRHADVDHHAFVALNTAYMTEGAFVYVPRGVVVERPVHLLMIGCPQGKPIAYFPRVLIVGAESSQLTVIEQYATVGAGAYFAGPVTEVVATANAVIDHYKLQRESTEAFHMATLQIHQDRDSNFSSHSISWGGGLVRNDVNAVLDGEGANSNLNGLYMVEGEQLIDNHMRVEHVKANCDSHELFKGILEGRSRAVFSGRIYVHPGAQKTDAKQTNRNLLLSRDALCNSNPQLEIFADDVKCTHGSTVGQLDDTAVFYLRSRGIGEEAARSLLTYAFAADIVHRIKVDQVRQDLEEFLFRRLPRGEVVRQAV